jgi:beta-keto acid cleavage enzyme
MGPMHGFFSMVGGGVAGVNPFDLMELIRRTPHGSVLTYQTMMRHSWPLASLCITLGQHTRGAIEENFWDARMGGKRVTSVQMIEKNARIARELGREIATADDARRIMKIGTWYNTVEETFSISACHRTAAKARRGFSSTTPTATCPKRQRRQTWTLGISCNGR